MDRAALQQYRQEAQRRVDALVDSQTDPVALLAELNQELGHVASEYRARCGGNWIDGEYAVVNKAVARALAEAESSAIAAAVSDEALREAVRQYFLLEGVERRDQGRIRYDQIARLGDERSVEMVFAAAEKMLPEYEDEFNPCPFYGLTHLAETDAHGSRAREILLGGFDAAIAAGEDDLVSDRTFVALGRAIGALRDASFAETLVRAIAFAGDPQADYELNVAACELAVQLSCLEYDGPLDALHALCRYLNETYQGREFSMRAQYALWMLTKDAAGALAYLGDESHDRGLGWAATACADLDVEPAVAVLQQRLPTLTNAVTREAFAEAIARLYEQNGRPGVDDRMVWMHGMLTRAELMSGMDTESVFEIRASLATGAPIGRIYEIDDSSAPDL